jgi:hypothetical protein
MKNKKIINAFDSILPSDDEKNKILSKILESNKTNSSNLNINKLFKPLVLVTCLCIVIFIFNTNYNKELVPETEITPMSINDTSLDTFNYNSNSYKPTGIMYNSSDVHGKILLTIEDVNSSFYGSQVYEGKDGKIIVYFNNVYKEYEKY